MKYIDLSHKVNLKIPVYSGDEKVKIKTIGTYKENKYISTLLTIGMHVGTHMDAPKHMIKKGLNISELKVDKFIGEGILIDARGYKQISKNLLKNVKIKKGSIVLLFTGFDKKYQQAEYFTNYPEMTEDFALELIKAGVLIFGSDTASPDYSPFKIHKLFFKKNILILENLTNLKKLVGIRKFEIIAFPVKFEGEGAPARVIAKIL